MTSGAPPPHVLFIARTYQPAAAVGLSLVGPTETCRVKNAE